MPDCRRPLLLSYATLTFAMLLWGSNSVIARLSVITMTPIGVSFWRWVVVVVVVLPFTWREIRHARPTIRAHWRILVALSITGPVAFNVLVYIGLLTTTAVNSAIASGAAPAATVLVSYLILRERVGWRTYAGMVAAFLGVLAVIARGDLGVLTALDIRAGDVLIIGGVVSWCVYTVLLKFRPPGLSSLALVAALMIIGVVFLFPFYVWELARGETIAINVTNISLIFYAGAVISVFANLCFIRGTAELGANVSSQFNNLIPLFGSALSVWMLNETFELYHLVGMILVLIGVYLAAAERRAVRHLPMTPDGR